VPPLIVPPLTGWNVRGYSYAEPTKLGLHPGADLNVGYGDDDLGLPVVTVAAGTVFAVRHWDGRSYGYGNVALIRHHLFSPPGQELTGHSALNLWGLYAHLDSFSPDLTPGAYLAAGTQIGTCGKSGFQQWAHLHFELRYAGPPIMPLDFATGHLTLDQISDHFADPFTALKILFQASEGLESFVDQEALRRDRDFNFALKQEFEHYLRSTRLYTRQGSRFVRVQDAADRLIAQVTR
jgi:peptidase M23-like protein